MKNRSFEDATHFYGRVWMLCAFLLIVSVPIYICVRYDAWPPITLVLSGLLGVAPIFWTVAVIEVITYVPMLGASGSYLGFVTGNLTNLKLPASLGAMDSAKVKPGTPEGDVISTIAIGVSSVTTTLVLAVGVILLAQLEPLLQSPLLQPAFENILPSLFGGLAVVFISKNWKIAMPPMIFMLVLFIAVPSLAGSVSVFVPVGSLIAIASARLMYKKGII